MAHLPLSFYPRVLHCALYHKSCDSGRINSWQRWDEYQRSAYFSIEPGMPAGSR